MPNKPIRKNKLRTIIRLYEGGNGLKSISSMSWTSRNTIKKYIRVWHSLKMNYEEFQRKSDSELHQLFCVKERPVSIHPHMLELAVQRYRIVSNPALRIEPKSGDKMFIDYYGGVPQAIVPDNLKVQ
jgi:hypothetical protein